MLSEIVASSEIGATILEWVDLAALAIEVLAVVIIVVSILFATTTYFFEAIRDRSKMPVYYRTLKIRLSRALLLGLEILVAADVVRTVALEPTLRSVAVLGLLVLIRTFLSWALVVEVEGRWPWQPRQPDEDIF
jgi:uncharacterized membrane protein